MGDFVFGIRSFIKNNNMTDRWTSTQNIKFVELYKDQAHLWNYLDPNYKNKDMRKDSLNYIRMEMGLQDTSEVSRKIKNLRSTYKQELAKIQKSKINGCSEEAIYRPTIKWFDAMDYIMKIIHIKKQPTSDLDPLHTSESEILFEDYSETSNWSIDTSSHCHNSDELQPPTKPKKPRTKLIMSPDQPDMQQSTTESELECDVIGKHVTAQLRLLPPIDRIDATDEIHAILSRYRKKSLSTTTIYTPYRSESEIEYK